MIRRYTTTGFDDRLCKVMKDRDVSITDLSKVLNADRKTVRGWMQGTQEPRAVMLREICLALDVSADYLIFGKVDRNECS